MSQALINSTLSTTTYKPRPYQIKIVNEVVQLYNGTYVDPRNSRQLDAHKRLLIESATGSGKTAMALVACKVLQHQIPNLHVAWVAMRRNLLKQAVKENIDSRTNVQNLHPISMFDKNPAAIHRAKAAGHPIIMVIDEGHHEAATSCVTLMDRLDPLFTLGMSATPVRTDKMKLCFDRTIKDAGIQQLIQDGYLAKYDHFTIPKWTTKNLLQAYFAEPERWGKSIFYLKNLKQCRQLHRGLLRGGAKADLVDGTTDCEKQLEAFQEGNLDVLVNCMKLVEGLDCPDLQTAWVRDSCRAPTMQMGGRVLRPFDGMIKQIVQSTETRWPFQKTADSRESYTLRGDQWLALKTNENIERISMDSLLTIACSDFQLPEYMQKRKAAKKAPLFIAHE